MVNQLYELKVSDRMSSIKFLDLLHQDLLQQPETWENKTLPDVHDKIHIHFNDGNQAALNIDGTWRHNPGNNYVIHERAKRELSALGFLLPDECYV
ncbi:hypothetical protein BWD42_05135 [Sphingobacterium sp. CZ-UAM]|uniref:hypothetical protein n=1 Tax=Sphingobacterium sp. CZ-UAM TaxID=1933868 RepID=UPI000987C3EE|nr:hypothetical protein [Sphingobacterium sp. CZ-UAM]OOG19324.1 hypothetical protein BWD42_05135 [Sphingobacterium sp. CZ-UAM]